jgi:hypothetical protein
VSTEHTFNRYLTSNLRKQGAKTWKINANFEDGVPDIWALIRRPIFIESKEVKQWPKRATTVFKPDCSKLQILWLDDLYSRGHLCLCAIRCGKLVLPLFTPAEWRTGITTAELQTRLLPQTMFIDQIVFTLNMDDPTNDHLRENLKTNPDPRTNS